MIARFGRAFLLLALCAAPVAAQNGGGKQGPHDHSTTAKGGNSLSPKTLSMPSNSTATFSGVARFALSHSSEGPVFIPNGYPNTGNSWMGVCYATATVTLIAGERVRIYFQGTFGSSSGGNQIAGFLRNGQFFAGQSTAKGLTSAQSYGGQGFDLYDTPGAGTWSYCLTGATSSGYLTFPIAGTSEPPCRFGVTPAL